MFRIVAIFVGLIAIFVAGAVAVTVVIVAAYAASMHGLDTVLPAAGFAAKVSLTAGPLFALILWCTSVRRALGCTSIMLAITVTIVCVAAGIVLFAIVVVFGVPEAVASAPFGPARGLPRAYIYQRRSR